MDEPRWLDDREARVWHAYLDVHRELHGALERQLVRDSGLSLADYSVLVPLSEAPDGLIRARELGAKVGWERSRLSHQIGRMEKRGLVAREECPEDARGSMVRLTPAGRAAIGAAAPGHVETVRRYLFDVLSEEESDVLGRAFARVLRRLGADRDEGRA
ncbi:MarR family winged helix-turn-helix transcriptional regulator [Actinosynnema sp. NPDC050436]|uniref:MarR family winged helix-turn-helix transcriptional regulator n=1 Tax=Actinosynnema sp. NPDC050436 TaxID=3155659 RepID=UPI0033D1BE33